MDMWRLRTHARAGRRERPAPCRRETRERTACEGARLVLLAALLLELALLLGGRVLVLLVLGHKVVHVGLGLGELHLVHALAGVPVEEGLAAEHRGELLGDTLHDLLHAGR